MRCEAPTRCNRLANVAGSVLSAKAAVLQHPPKPPASPGITPAQFTRDAEIMKP